MPDINSKHPIPINKQSLISRGLENKEERKLAVLKAQKERESAFKLVVKIISWESGSIGSAAVQTVNKINPKEWLQYKKQRLSIATSDTRDKAKEKLAQTFRSIKENGGFE